MREIKFRAWHKNRECFVPIEAHFSFDTNGELYQTDGKPIELMQYTGLKDKNGVSIYEGDIIKYKTFYYGKEKEHIVEVKWEKEATDLFGEPDFIGFLARWEGGEVIGHIYETPELLDKD